MFKKGKNIKFFWWVYKKTINLIDWVAHLVISRDPEEFFFRKKIFKVIPEAARKKHVYITGRSWSGKSELIKWFVYGYLKKAQSNKTWLRKHIIVMDPHWDLAKEIRDFDILDSQDVIYVDPFYKEGYSPVINPFYLPKKEKNQANIDRMTQELVKAFEQLMSDRELSSSMKALLMPCIATLLRLENSSILDLQNFMDIDDVPEDLIAAWKQSDNPTHKRFFNKWFHKKIYNRTKNSLYLKIQNTLNSSIFSDVVLWKNTIYLEKILNNSSGKVIIFNLAKWRLWTESSHALWQFVLALIRVVALKRDMINKNNRVPIHFFIDEFHNYMWDEILEWLAELRKYRVHFWLASQILWQWMSGKDRHLVLSNTNVKIIWQNTNKTLKKISKEAGVDIELLENLKTWKFVIKRGTFKEFIFDMPGYLIWERHEKNKKEKEWMKKHQISNYYKKLEG